MTEGPLVAVTGGTGFLGRHAVSLLAGQGWRVRMLVRGAPPAGIGADGIETMRGDLSDPAALRRLVAGAEAVLHLAGLTAARRAEDFMAVNRDGSARLAEAVEAVAPAARGVLVSSLAAREPALSPYAASKRAGEAAVLAVSPRWAVLRPSVIYGPGDVAGLALRRLAAAPLVPVPRAPEPRIAMVHARDVASAAAALCRSGPFGEAFEVTDARADGYGWRELVRHLAAAMGRRRVPRFVTVPDAAMRSAGRAADLWARATGRGGLFGLGKAEEILHRDWASDPGRQPPPSLWAPRIGLEEGLRETRAWWDGLERAGG